MYSNEDLQDVKSLFYEGEVVDIKHLDVDPAFLKKYIYVTEKCRIEAIHKNVIILKTLERDNFQHRFGLTLHDFYKGLVHKKKIFADFCSIGETL